jgi:cephalosporin-C deacetylase-like acetyl esterase
VLTDDLVAFGVLAAADGVDPARLGTFGFSGGAGRSLLLAALDHRGGACVVSCMMATFHDHLLRQHAATTRYRGSFTPGGHAFDAAMQEEAWAFLAEAL